MEMTSLFALPALLKILLTFVVLLVFNRKLPLYVCLAGTSIMIGLWMQMSPLSIIRVMLRESFSGPVLALSLAIALILMFSDLLRRSGLLDRIVSSLKAISSGPSVSLVLLPALIGLLPMPGGALFSAPMIETALGDTRVKPELKLAINYWFRHIWEYCMPTYPGVILSASLLGLSFGQIFMLNFPLTIAAIIAGLVFGLSGIKYDKKERPEKVNMEGMKYFLYAIIPLLVIIVLALVFKVPVYLAIIISIIFMALANKSGLHAMYKMFIKSFSFTIVSVVLGIMSFKAVMENSGIISQMSAEFISWHIPVMLLLFILPFLTALITGLTQPFVAIAFPLLMTYLSNDHSLLTWAYASGYMGVLLSPVHYCLVLTREYFKASWKDVYKILIIPCAIVLATAYVVVKLRG